jgi:L-histidine Nalpha-methyltransferase
MGDYRLVGGSAHTGDDADAFAADVRAGLTASPRQLSCRWFYDREGSILFERICALPEYYIPDAEAEILEARAGQIVAALPGCAAVVELGSGSARKTRRVLEAFLEHGRLTYVPIDVSVDVLVASSRGLAADYPGLDVTAVAGTYEEGLERLAEVAPAPRLVLWLGSNVGNFPRPQAAAFLAGVRERLGAGDALLMGVDLRKDARTIELAYDDPGGVTAQFNKNLLARVNRELGGDLDLDAFAHRATYREDEGRVDISLVSRRAQRIRVGALDLEVELGEGEAIHTEDSYKYSLAELYDLAEAAGFAVAGRFFDAARRFCDILLRP